MYLFYAVKVMMMMMMMMNFGDSATSKGQLACFFIAHARNGHISISCQKYDVTIVYDFIICSMLYAIAIVQIISLRLSVCPSVCVCVCLSVCAYSHGCIY